MADSRSSWTVAGAEANHCLPFTWISVAWSRLRGQHRRKSKSKAITKCNLEGDEPFADGFVSNVQNAQTATTPMALVQLPTVPVSMTHVPLNRVLKERNHLFGLDPLASTLVTRHIDPATAASLRLVDRRCHALVAGGNVRLILTCPNQVARYGRRLDEEDVMQDNEQEAAVTTSTGKQGNELYGTLQEPRQKQGQGQGPGGDVGFHGSIQRSHVRAPSLDRVRDHPGSIGMEVSAGVEAMAARKAPKTSPEALPLQLTLDIMPLPPLLPPLQRRLSASSSSSSEAATSASSEAAWAQWSVQASNNSFNSSLPNCFQNTTATSIPSLGPAASLVPLPTATFNSTSAMPRSPKQPPRKYTAAAAAATTEITSATTNGNNDIPIVGRGRCLLGALHPALEELYFAPTHGSIAPLAAATDDDDTLTERSVAQDPGFIVPWIGVSPAVQVSEGTVMRCIPHVRDVEVQCIDTAAANDVYGREMRQLIASGALWELAALRLVDLTGCTAGFTVAGATAWSDGGGDRDSLQCTVWRLSRCDWFCLVNGLPPDRPLLLRLPLRLMPGPLLLPPPPNGVHHPAWPPLSPSLAPLQSGPVAAATGEAVASYRSPMRAANTTAQEAAAPRGAAAIADGSRVAAAVPLPLAMLMPPTPDYVLSRDLVAPEVVRQLLMELYDSRPLVRVEIVPYKNSRHDGVFMTTANGPNDLTRMPPNLIAAPIYITASSLVDLKRAELFKPWPTQPSGHQPPSQPSGHHPHPRGTWLPPSLTSLSLSGFIPDDNGLLRTLAGLSKLRRLYLVGMVLGSRGLAQLAALSSLSHLTVDVLALEPLVSAPLHPVHRDMPPAAPGPAAHLPPAQSPPASVLPGLRSLVVHDMVAMGTVDPGVSGVWGVLAAVAPGLEMLSLGDTVRGAESRDLRRRSQARHAAALQRRHFLSAGGLCDLSRLRHLELWDQIFPLSELSGCTSLQSLVLNGLLGGPWTAQLAEWTVATAPPLRHLHLRGCKAECRLLLPPAGPLMWGLMAARPLVPPPPAPSVAPPAAAGGVRQGQGERQGQQVPAHTTLGRVSGPLRRVLTTVAAGAVQPTLDSEAFTTMPPIMPLRCGFRWGVYDVEELTVEACDEDLVADLTAAAAASAASAQLHLSYRSLRRLRRLNLLSLGSGTTRTKVTALVASLPGLQSVQMAGCVGLVEEGAQGLAAAVGRPGLSVACWEGRLPHALQRNEWEGEGEE